MGLLKDFKYYAPATLKEALGALKNARHPLVLGGGTFSLNHLKKAAKYPTDVIGLKKVYLKSHYGFILYLYFNCAHKSIFCLIPLKVREKAGIIF